MPETSSSAGTGHGGSLKAAAAMSITRSIAGVHEERFAISDACSSLSLGRLWRTSNRTENTNERVGRGRPTSYTSAMRNVVYGLLSHGNSRRLGSYA
jgi:hypothetical protein